MAQSLPAEGLVDLGLERAVVGGRAGGGELGRVLRQTGAARAAVDGVVAAEGPAARVEPRGAVEAYV